MEGWEPSWAEASVPGVPRLRGIWNDASLLPGAFVSQWCQIKDLRPLFHRGHRDISILSDGEMNWGPISLLSSPAVPGPAPLSHG